MGTLSVIKVSYNIMGFGYTKYDRMRLNPGK
jgi:hypothetical protein